MSYASNVKRWAITSINDALNFASASVKARHLNDQEMPSQNGIFVGVEPSSVINRQLGMQCDLRIIVIANDEPTCVDVLDRVRRHFNFDAGARRFVDSETADPATKDLKVFDITLAQEVPPDQQGPEGKWIGQRLYQVKGRDTSYADSV